MATVMSGGGDWIGFPVNHLSTMPASAPHARAAFSSPVYLYCFQLKRKWKELQMYSSSNLLVLGVTGQVGKLVAKHLKRSKTSFSVGSRRKENLKELADQFGASRFIDLDDPRTFDQALKDVTGIFLITGYTVDMFMQNLLGNAAIKGGRYSYYTSKALGYTALEDVAESAARILIEGPTKHSGKDYWFSADVLTAKQVAETLAEATGRKFTAAVRTAEAFQSEAEQPGSIFEPAYAKGGLEFFRYVEDGRMAYVGSVKDDTEKILGREPLLLRKWAKLHVNELLEIAGS